jgi:hypothetical protein
LIEINDGARFCEMRSADLIDGNSAVPKCYMMPNGGHRSAPRMLAALTSLVHHGQRTHGDEHDRDQGNDQGVLHSDLTAQPLTGRILVL